MIAIERVIDSRAVLTGDVVEKVVRDSPVGCPPGIVAPEFTIAHG